MSANANNTPHAPIIDAIKQASIPSINPGSVLSKRYSQEQIPDLSGRTAVVLGGSAGIGSAIAAGLALAQARVLIVSTTEEHAERTIDSVNEKMREAGSSGSIHWMGCDLGNLKSVMDVTEKILDKESRLDMLMLDAGIGVGPFGHTHDGLSTHYQVNNLSHYVFSLRLLPLLEKTAQMPGVAKGQVRIVSMSSELHRTIPSDVKFATKEEINTDVGPNGLYARSKLGVILFTRGLIKHKLSDISPQNPVYAIAVHPGAVATGQQNMLKEEGAYPLLGQILGPIVKILGKTPEQGAESALWALTWPDAANNDGKDFNGEYFDEPFGKPGKEIDAAKDPELVENFWSLAGKLTREILGKDL